MDTHDANRVRRLKLLRLRIRGRCCENIVVHWIIVHVECRDDSDAAMIAMELIMKYLKEIVLCIHVFFFLNRYVLFRLELILF